MKLDDTTRDAAASQALMGTHALAAHAEADGAVPEHIRQSLSEAVDRLERALRPEARKVV